MVTGPVCGNRVARVSVSSKGAALHGWLMVGQPQVGHRDDSLHYLSWEIVVCRRLRFPQIGATFSICVDVNKGQSRM